MNENIENLKVMYSAAFDAVKAWVDSRYKMFQFCAIITVGSLTLGFDKKLLLSPSDPIPGIFLCILNLFVAAIGLRTEINNRKYNILYFDVMNEIEAELNKNEDGKDVLQEGGPFTRGRRARSATWIRKLPNIDQFHVIFYGLMMLIWAVLLCRI